MKHLAVIAPLLVVLTLAVAGGPTSRDAMAACTQAKATAYEGSADQLIPVYQSQTAAQTFKVPAGVTLSKVSLFLRNVGPPITDPVTVGIHSNVGTKAPGPLLGGTRTRVLSNTTAQFADFDFSADKTALVRGVTYYIVASNTQANMNEGYQWG